MMERFTTVGRLSLKEVAIERIKTAIFEGEFQPGERLNDAQLQTWLGISRSPLREALSELTRVGLIETAPQRYTRVTTGDPARVDEHIQFLGTLVGGIVRVTVPALDQNPAKAQLLASIDGVLAAVTGQDSPAFWRSNKDLVNTLLALCPNEVLVTFAHDILDATMYQIEIAGAADRLAEESSAEKYQQFRHCVDTADALGAEQIIEEIYGLAR